MVPQWKWFINIHIWDCSRNWMAKKHQLDTTKRNATNHTSHEDQLYSKKFMVSILYIWSVYVKIMTWSLFLNDMCSKQSHHSEDRLGLDQFESIVRAPGTQGHGQDKLGWPWRAKCFSGIQPFLTAFFFQTYFFSVVSVLQQNCRQAIVVVCTTSHSTQSRLQRHLKFKNQLYQLLFTDYLS